MPTELPLDALEMALWTRAQANELVEGLIHHSDAGGQYTSIRYSERLADVGAVASIGTVGDSYDCEMLTGSSGRVRLLLRQAVECLCVDLSTRPGGITKCCWLAGRAVTE